MLNRCSMSETSSSLAIRPTVDSGTKGHTHTKQPHWTHNPGYLLISSFSRLKLLSDCCSSNICSLASPIRYEKTSATSPAKYFGYLSKTRTASANSPNSSNNPSVLLDALASSRLLG